MSSTDLAASANDSGAIDLTPPAASMACRTRASDRSTASTAIVAARKLPVWPTMSPLAKLQRRVLYWPDWMAAIIASAISAAFIHGLCSKGTTSLGTS